MYDYIKGKVDTISPANIVLDNQGIGYLLNISLTTYTAVSGQPEFKLFVHEVIREDTHELYGFATQHERDVFRLLIGVSGVGSNTARLMLSSMNPADLEAAIATAHLAVLKSIKGIGEKTAQRIIVELRDKVGKHKESGAFLTLPDNTTRNEALTGLVMLGFAKPAVEKALDKLLTQTPGLTVEDLIKQALRML